MTQTVQEQVERLGITRICHFTPSQNLVHIATGEGVFSTRHLSEQARRSFNQQDLARLDGHPDHISCSIQFPNAWYFRQRILSARGAAKLFTDWVVLGIDPHHLWRDGTRFCPRNAAAQGGRLIADGPAAFEALYADSVQGAGGTYVRGADRQPAVPTDDQAEVLIHRQVPLADVQAVFVKDEAQAKREYARLQQIGADPDQLNLTIAPDFFNANRLSQLLRNGRRPEERPWQPARP